MINIDYLKIDYNYWLDKWTEKTGNTQVRKVKYSTFRGTLNECENRILEIVNKPNLNDDDILTVIDLINHWGGSESRHFYIDKRKKIEDGKILINNPRNLITIPENLNIYKLGINKAKRNDLDSLNHFLKIYGIGPSYIGKHAYFWSNRNLPIIDAKIAGVLGFKSSTTLLNTYSYQDIISIMENLRQENKLSHISDIEKAWFAFHKNYFNNSNTNFKKNIEDKTDLVSAIELAKRLEIENSIT